MFMQFRPWLVRGTVVAALLNFVPSASAQFFIGNGGAYGGFSSIEVFSSGYGGGFAAGVITPFPYCGWGGGFYDPYACGPFGYGGGGYGYGGGYWGGGFYAAPLVIPAETMYGPGPVRRMMGLDPPLGTPIVNQTIINNPPPKNTGGFGVLAQPQQNGVPQRPNVFVSNASTQQRARKFIDQGDTAFQQQRFAEALSSYADARRTAPDLADTYFRQAAAAMALGRFDEATDAVKFGLKLAPNWVDSRFRFSALYGPAAAAREAHLENLIRTANDRPTSDMMFLLGVALFFDDAPRTAQAPLDRARALAVGESWHIDLFLKALERLPPDAAQPAGAAQPVNAAKPILPDQRPANRPPDDGAREI
jgi:hypothetical protein